MATPTLSFPATQGHLSQATGRLSGTHGVRRLPSTPVATLAAFARPLLTAPQIRSATRIGPQPRPVTPTHSSRSATRLHLVTTAEALLPASRRSAPVPSPAAQARRVAAQIEWEVALQASRRLRPARPTGTLLLLPVVVTRPSAGARVAEALRRFFRF